MVTNKYSYDCRFTGNILILGQIAGGKTTFVQNLGKHKMFRKIKDVSCVTKIVSSKEREHQIKSCFDVPIEFCYPQDLREFDIVIEYFQRKKENGTNHILGENHIFDRLIVMDDVSRLADRSNSFGSFLTVARKFNITCVYVFHIMYRSKLNWQMIILQTKIFNTFPGSIQTSWILKILSANCNRYNFDYIPNRNLWLNRRYFEITNLPQDCLIIDCRNFNSIGPSKI